MRESEKGIVHLFEPSRFICLFTPASTVDSTCRDLCRPTTCEKAARVPSSSSPSCPFLVTWLVSPYRPFKHLCISKMEQCVAPFVVPGYEPGPGGVAKTPEERRELLNSIKQMRLVQAGIESPVAKATLSGGMGQYIPASLSSCSMCEKLNPHFSLALLSVQDSPLEPFSR
jgi:hypothetical protein